MVHKAQLQFNSNTNPPVYISNTKLNSRLRQFLLLVLITFGMFLFIRACEFIQLEINTSHFKSSRILSALLVGLVFDSAATAKILALPTVLLFIPLPKIIGRWRQYLVGIALIVIAIPLFSLSWIDIELSRFTQRKLRFEDLSLLTEGALTLNTLLKQHAITFLASISTIALWVYLVIKILNRKHGSSSLSSYRLVLAELLMLLAIVPFFVAAIRGGPFADRPLHPVNAYPDPLLGRWSLNTTFSVLNSFKDEPLTTTLWFDNKTNWYRYLNYWSKDANVQNKPLHAFEKPQNVVVIVLESLTSGYLNQSNVNYQAMPFLEELSKRSLYLPNILANGTQSIEGIPAILGEVPSLNAKHFLRSQYALVRFNGLGTLLGQAGYKTAFFHGARRDSMSFNSFSKHAGFHSHFAVDDYPHAKDHDKSWGIYDGPYFQYVIEQIDQLTEKNNSSIENQKNDQNESSAQSSPFAVALFSLSGHHPFVLPSDFRSTLPAEAHPMLHAQNYVDSAIKSFFEIAQTKPWYNHTLFVITGDHTGYPLQAKNENDPLKKWEIPLIFFHPNMRWPALEKNTVVQQIDIVPSIMDFLGMDYEKKNFLSRSIFIPGERTAAIKFNEGFYFVNQKYALFFPHDKSSPYKLIDRSTGLIVDNENEANEVLLNRGRAILQYFNTGMLEDKLIR